MGFLPIFLKFYGKFQGAVAHRQNISLINLLQMRKLVFYMGGLVSQTVPGKPSIVSVQVFLLLHLGLVDSPEPGCAWHGVCLSFARGCDGAQELYLQNMEQGR